MNGGPILHAIAWTLYQLVASAVPGQTAENSLKSGTIADGSIFPHCQNFDEYDRAFGILAEQDLLCEIPYPSAMLDHFLPKEFRVYRLSLKAENLASHLSAFGVSPVISDEDLIRCLLQLTWTLQLWSEAVPICLPTFRGWAGYPDVHAAAVIELRDAGYCLQSGSQMCWLPKIEPLMTIEGIWIEGRPSAEVWQEELEILLYQLPGSPKHIFYGNDGEINPLAVGRAFRHFWDPEKGWLDNPRSLPLNCRQYPLSPEQLHAIAKMNRSKRK